MNAADFKEMLLSLPGPVERHFLEQILVAITRLTDVEGKRLRVEIPRPELVAFVKKMAQPYAGVSDG